MCFIQVTCGNCGAEYPIFGIGEMADMCPHCLARMPQKAFKKLENAIYTVEEVNKDLRTAHSDREEPLFQIEVRNHYVPAEKFNQN